MARMKHKWVKLKGTRRGKSKHGLRCVKCGNRLMLIILEPLKRQVRSWTAHHLRVIAKCPLCKGEYRIKLGPAGR